MYISFCMAETRRSDQRKIRKHAHHLIFIVILVSSDVEEEANTAGIKENLTKN